MAFTPFNFTKSWRSPTDFPRFESDEAKVRDDMQSLFDELKVGLDRLMSELKAANIPFTPTAAVDSSDVQNAIENVQAQIESIIVGELPPGSIGTTQLAADAVKTEKIEDGAVTLDKLAEHVLPEPATELPLAPGTADVGESDKLAREDHVHPQDSTKADLSGGKVLPTQLSKSRVNVTASRALELTDDGKILFITGTSEIVVTIPLNSTVQLPVGCEIVIYRDGEGAVSIAGVDGVNVTCSTDLDSLKRYETVQLKKWGANDWNVEFNHNVIPEGSITDYELADDAVKTDKIEDEAVTTDKLDDGAVTAAKMANGVIPIVVSVELDADSWVGTESPYSQTLDGTVLGTYKVDLQPDATTIAQLIEDGVSALYIENDNGTLTAYAIGEKPTVDLTIQATQEEVRE